MPLLFIFGQPIIQFLEITSHIKEIQMYSLSKKKLPQMPMVILSRLTPELATTLIIPFKIYQKRHPFRHNSGGNYAGK